MNMETYNKHLISERNTFSDIKNMNNLITIMKLIGDISSLKNIPSKQRNNEINRIIHNINVILRKTKIKPIYKKMINCGVKIALEELK